MFEITAKKPNTMPSVKTAASASEAQDEAMKLRDNGFSVEVKNLETGRVIFGSLQEARAKVKRKEFRDARESSPGGITLETVLDEATKTSKRYLRVEIATVDVINQNRRFYPRSAYEAANTRAEADMKVGKLWALLEHPSWDEGRKGELEDIAGKYESLTIEGNIVVGRVLVPHTDAGDVVIGLLEAGIAVGVSTNGAASQSYVRASTLDPTYPFPDEEISVIGDDFTYNTIDFVADPSNLGGLASFEARMKEARRKVEKMKKPAWLKKLEASNAELAAKIWEALQDDEDTLTLMGEAIAGFEAAMPKIVASSIAPLGASAVETELEKRVLALTTRLEQSEAGNLKAGRVNIAVSALEAANLPKTKPVSGLDLDARFRDQLEAASINAESDDTARTAVTDLIAERAALLGVVAKTEDTPRGRASVQTENHSSGEKVVQEQKGSFFSSLGLR